MEVTSSSSSSLSKRRTIQNKKSSREGIRKQALGQVIPL